VGTNPRKPAVYPPCAEGTNHTHPQLCSDGVLEKKEVTSMSSTAQMFARHTDASAIR